MFFQKFFFYIFFIRLCRVFPTNSFALLPTSSANPFAWLNKIRPNCILYESIHVSFKACFLYSLQMIKNHLFSYKLFLNEIEKMRLVKCDQQNKYVSSIQITYKEIVSKFSFIDNNSPVLIFVVVKYFLFCFYRCC